MGELLIAICRLLIAQGNLLIAVTSLLRHWLWATCSLPRSTCSLHWPTCSLQYSNLLIAVSNLLEHCSRQSACSLQCTTLPVAMKHIFHCNLPPAQSNGQPADCNGQPDHCPSQPAHCIGQCACSLECATCGGIAKCQKLIASIQTAGCRGDTCS